MDAPPQADGVYDNLINKISIKDTIMAAQKKQIFISYARDDIQTAEKIYNDLKKAGLNPWIDKESLLPGQRWKVEIKKAIKNSSYFIALLSSKSVSKRGYVQKELKEAIELLDEFPETQIFLIPVRLDKCTPSHEKIVELNRVDLFPSYEEGLRKILHVLTPEDQGIDESFLTWLNTALDYKVNDIGTFIAQQSKFIDVAINRYPQAIQDIEREYGFHFERGDNIKVAETERFILYQIRPFDLSVKVNKNGKPVIILPSYVLGANILAFLPYENRSYTHCFANQGIPTYVRIIKEIDTTPAVQVMEAEDDVSDTRFFCEEVMAKHGRMVSLNGFCQGGFIAMANILSGELDGLVDALIACMAPMDGTRSKPLVEYVQYLPPQFRDLGYALKTLPNNNQVADGSVMNMFHKLRSVESKHQLHILFQALMTFKKQDKITIRKDEAAINHWLFFENNDLPPAIAKFNFDSYTIPVDKDGTLPIKLFGRKLNFKRLKEKDIKFLICYAEKDDLVSKESALAPLDYIDAQVTVFPKRHVDIATSWSDPKSDCALHTSFGDNCRGPVRYHLDLGEE